MIPDLELWELGVYDLGELKSGGFFKLEDDRKDLFLKNLKWLQSKISNGNKFHDAHIVAKQRSRDGQ